MNPPPPAVATLLEQLLAQVSQPPPPHLLPVIVGSIACGWTRSDVAEALQPEGQQPLGPARQVQLAAADAPLEQAARRLQRAGHLKRWRDEPLDVLDAQDRVLARIERAAMRPLGLRTRAVHLHATAPDGRLWVARRAEHKSTDPGQWDTLVGGLIGAGETPHQAMLRESAEEAGLQPADLADAMPLVRFDVRRVVPEGYQHETTQVWTCCLPATCRPQNCDGEVAEITLATASEVVQQIAAGHFTVEAALSILQWLAAGDGAPAIERRAGFAAQR